MDDVSCGHIGLDAETCDHIMPSDLIHELQAFPTNASRFRSTWVISENWWLDMVVLVRFLDREHKSVHVERQYKRTEGACTVHNSYRINRDKHQT